jgi:uncharacterized protein YyaL (SSP411 family)
MTVERRPNLLIREKSPYLLQHAYNPVEWHPWGPEAFEKARAEKRMIFLSIGYSTCHWCHVMEHESFENEKIAAILNEHFVSIKVDREERPDVDRIYMTFVQSTTGSGGWPMSVFLTPDLKPFLGGTYYPPEDRWGRPGFGTLLSRLVEIWTDSPGKIVDQGNRFTDALGAYLNEAQSKPSGALNPGWLKNAYRQFAASFDPEEGGFGGAPKFPRPSVFNFLLRYAGREPATDAREMTLYTLQKMASGGMYDQIGGGFHRYSVDARWHVPHFEKMLYDQAQLAAVYTDAYLITGDTFYRRIATETLDYVLRDLAAPEGGFYSAEDADSLPAAGAEQKLEGAFYVWTQAEIDAALSPEEAPVFRRTYGVEQQGNVASESDPHGELAGRNVLFLQNDPELVGKLTGRTQEEVVRLLQSARAKLKAVRDQRPRPHLDDKIITAWNGLMITALARAASAFGERRFLDAATKAAGFLRANLYPQRLLRSYRLEPGKTFAFAEDYAFLIQGLLELYEAGFDIEWLKWAGELQVQINALFADPLGGFYSTEVGAADLLFRMREDHDGAEPSANSIGALNLVRLSRILDRSEFQVAATRAIGRFAEALERGPTALPQLLVAVDAALTEPAQVVIAGEPDRPDLEAMLAVVRARFMPHLVVLLADGGDGRKWLSEHIPAIRGMGSLEGKAAAYVCRSFTCEIPVTEPAQLEEKLKGLQ